MFRRCVAGCRAFSRGFIHLLTNGLQFNVGATILPVVCVGNYAIAGADSVVTKNMPDYAVVVGNPAKVVKHWIQAGFSKNGVNN